MIEKLESQLDSFNADQRKAALLELAKMADEGKVTCKEPKSDVNMHCHTFFSYNSYGYSPSKYAWLAKKEGLAVAGVVDFDVLEALEEFTQACEILGVKGCGGLETRTFVPQLADKELNSPGEPGISYHMGMGFPTAQLEGTPAEFLANLKQTAQKRNRELIDRVNKHLAPASLDCEKDVSPLTPSGNLTERHICLAYARKAAEICDGTEELKKFWEEKLGTTVNEKDLPQGRDLINTIRAKTMKQGGVGYVKPDAGAFPNMAETNEFITAANGIAVMTWLNGLSDGEKDIEKLFEVSTSCGATAINIIPDRNYTPGVKDQKLANLQQVVEFADKLGLPVIVGTEMNSPGQKFVDSFETEELKPLVPIFLKGALILYAHSVLQRQCGIGYTGKWAKENFANVFEKNAFFAKLGEMIDPKQQNLLDGLDENASAAEIFSRISN